jgi:hypothetical protein
LGLRISALDAEDLSNLGPGDESEAEFRHGNVKAVIITAAFARSDELKPSVTKPW